MVLLAVAAGCDVAFDLVAPVTKTPPVMPSDYYQFEDHPVAPSTPAASGPVVQPSVAALDAIQDDAVVYGKTIEKRYRAKVVRIVDGDTLVVLNDANEQIKIRLEGIDTPEPGQPFGSKSKEKLSELTFGKTVVVAVTGTDFFKRTLGYIEIPIHTFAVDPINANAELIRYGFAWHYKSYNSSPELAEFETAARTAKIGLWGGSETPVPPWEWMPNSQSRDNSKTMTIELPLNRDDLRQRWAAGERFDFYCW